MLNKVAVIIPAFNEEKTIGNVIRGLQGHASEIIVVNDCSVDNTAIVARDVGAVVVSNEKNRGYDGSIQRGFEEAMQRGADILVTCDADGQHTPSDVSRLTEIIKEGKADVVVGQRQKITHFAEKIMALYTRYRFGIRDPLCGLKAYHRKVYETIGHFDTVGSIGTQLMVESALNGFRLAKVSIQINERKDDSRFYTKKIKANIKILKALFKIIFLKKQ